MEIKTDRFKKDLPGYIANTQVRKNVKRATFLTLDKRSNTLNEFPQWEEWREEVHLIKQGIIDNLDKNIELFLQNAQKNGMKTYLAKDGQMANSIVESIFKEHQAKKAVKSKSMLTEEIGLNHHLEKKGFEIVETDLGEYILQLANETPSHLIGPAIHKTKEDVAQLFHEKLGIEYNDSPEYLTKAARKILRDKFWEADIGITGANFGIIEDGSIVLVENEGNARFTIASPKVHIILMGMEKLIQNLKQLARFLPMLCVSGNGQKMTGYISINRGPRKEGEIDGPEHVYLILVDNGRKKIWSDVHLRKSLYCIRCSACYNTCPVYRNIGGHAYGWVYQGPIGAVITPHLVGLKKAKHLPFASSLCGSCTDICPVKIPLHHLLLYNRNLIARQKIASPEKLAFLGFKWMMNHHRIYRLLSGFGKSMVNTLQIKPAVSAWTSSREFPDIPKKSFRDIYKEMEQGEENE
ncbi:MAG: LutB/LldF family L-lactate oxidation iron-sulfur protein [Calditrichia bacterium]